MIKYTPCGLSIQQLKKDAKKIKKNESIKMSNALNIVSEKYTSFKKWSHLIDSCSSNGDSLHCLKIKDIDGKINKFVTFKDKPITCLLSPPGYGKSIVVEHFLKNIDATKSKFLYTGSLSYLKVAYYHNLGKGFLNKENFMMNNKVSISPSSNDNFLKNVYEKIDYTFDFLIFDEFSRISNSKESGVLLKQIIKKCSDLEISIIISSQIMGENFSCIKEYISNLIVISEDYNQQLKLSPIINYSKHFKQTANVFVGCRVYNLINKESRCISIEKYFLK
jgi:hypothetical protein